MAQHFKKSSSSKKLIAALALLLVVALLASVIYLIAFRSQDDIELTSSEDQDSQVYSLQESVPTPTPSSADPSAPADPSPEATSSSPTPSAPKRTPEHSHSEDKVGEAQGPPAPQGRTVTGSYKAPTVTDAKVVSCKKTSPGAFDIAYTVTLKGGNAWATNSVSKQGDTHTYKAAAQVDDVPAHFEVHTVQVAGQGKSEDLPLPSPLQFDEGRNCA